MEDTIIEFITILFLIYITYTVTKSGMVDAAIFFVKNEMFKRNPKK